MNTEDYVSYPIAVALKAAGFDAECREFYTPKGDLGTAADADDFNSLGAQYQGEWFSNTISAPSLYAAQKWLREKKEIFVEVTSEALHDWDFFVMELDEDANVGVVRGSEIYPSYESALSAGIAAALELIKPAHQ